MVHISQLYLYPVKSCRAVSLQRADVESRGFAGDRRWLIVNQNNEFITQRDEPKLALMHATYTPKGLRLSANSLDPIDVSFPIGTYTNVKIWDDAVEAIAADKSASEWVSKFMGRRSKLVFMPSDSIRIVDQEFGRHGDIVSFADGFPLLLASESSLAQLNGHLEAKIPISRFRPSIVIDGAEPFAEDRWKEIKIGDGSFRVVKRCARCKVTTIDQDTGTPTGNEPLKTLAAVNAEGNEVFFGQNLIPNGECVIRVGDDVTIVN